MSIFLLLLDRDDRVDFISCRASSLNFFELRFLENGLIVAAIRIDVFVVNVFKLVSTVLISGRWPFRNNWLKLLLSALQTYLF